MKEFERARLIFKYGLSNMSKEKSLLVQKAYTEFEKLHGNSEGIDDVIIRKRRSKYEDVTNQTYIKEVRRNPRNYDAWFDYSKLEESGGDFSLIRDVYERGISQLPPSEVTMTF